MNRPISKRIQGFTLIEIMVVVALIAILSAIAMPAYNNYINRGKLKTAQADLIALSLNLENFYQKRLTYPSDAYAITATVKGAFPGWSPASGSEFNFSTATSTVAGNPGAGYTVTATGVSGGVNNCVLTITNAGVRGLTNCAYGDGDWL